MSVDSSLKTSSRQKRTICHGGLHSTDQAKRVDGAIIDINDANPDKARILETLTKALSAVNTQQVVDETNKTIFAAAGK